MDSIITKNILFNHCKRMELFCKINISIFLILVVKVIARIIESHNLASYQSEYLVLYSLYIVVNILGLFGEKISGFISAKFVTSSYIIIINFIIGMIAILDFKYYQHMHMFILFYLVTNILMVMNKKTYITITLIYTFLITYAIFIYSMNTTEIYLNCFFLMLIIGIGAIVQFNLHKGLHLYLAQGIQLEEESNLNKQLVIELAEANEKLSQLAYEDALTKLPNRHAYHKYVGNLLELHNKLEMSIFVLDIDYFKQYNDYYGHNQGDMALEKVALVLKEIMNRHNMYFVRWGGEEFLGILQENPSNVNVICQEIEQEIKNLNIINEGISPDCYLTVSIGVFSAVASSERQILDIYQKADAALYEAKKNGRDQCIMKA